MCLHRACAHVQPLGDLLVLQTFGDTREYLTLAGCQLRLTDLARPEWTEVRGPVEIAAHHSFDCANQLVFVAVLGDEAAGAGIEGGVRALRLTRLREDDEPEIGCQIALTPPRL